MSENANPRADSCYQPGFSESSSLITRKEIILPLIYILKARRKELQYATKMNE